MQANEARKEANRLKKEQEAEAKRQKKAAKSQQPKKATVHFIVDKSSCISFNADADKLIVHFTVDVHLTVDKSYFLARDARSFVKGYAYLTTLSLSSSDGRSRRQVPINGAPAP